MRVRIAAVAVLLAVCSSVVAAATPSEAEKERCFKAHKQLMHKPAVQNPRDCWNTHKHLHKAQ